MPRSHEAPAPFGTTRLSGSGVVLPQMGVGTWAWGDKTTWGVNDYDHWLVCKGPGPIPGAKNRAKADQNAGALGWRLSTEDMEALGRAAKRGQRRLMHRVWQHG